MSVSTSAARTTSPAAPPPGTRRLAAARVTRTLLDNLLALAALGLAVLAPGVVRGYALVVLTFALVYAVVLVSLVVLTGYVGQVSLCQASFMGLGAYLMAALMGHYGWSFWVAAPVACVLVFLVGVAVGLPALRLKGLTLAIVTLSLALLADNFLFVDIGWLTNGSNGWTIAKPHLFRLSLNDQVTLYYVILAVTALAITAVIRLRRGRTGKSWFAMRDAEIAASTSGVSITTMKLLGFGVAAALAALGGTLFALAVGSVSPQPFTFDKSIELLAIAVIAGVRSLPGAVLGALFYIVLPQLLLLYPPLVPLTSLILGCGLILQSVFAPQGLGGALEAAETRLFRRLAGAGRNAVPGASEAARNTGERG